MPSALIHSPATAPEKAQILIVHGLGEHQGRYDALVRELNAWGYGGWRFDLPGHGQTAGARGDAAHSHALLEECAAQIDAVRQHCPGKPLVLLGHSLGGLIASRTVAGALRGEAFGRQPDFLVLSSPALDPGMSAAQKGLLALARRLFPHLAISNGLKPEWVSRDPAVVRAYVEDPLVHDRVSATVAAMVADGGPQVIADAARWAVPTLLLWAGADRCVAPQGSAAFADAASPALVQRHCFAGLAHEIFNEPERGQVLAVLRTALDARFAG